MLGWLFDFLKNQWFCYFENLKTKGFSFSFFRIFRINKPPVPIFPRPLKEMSIFVK
jgi:hypothetical protein